MSGISGFEVRDSLDIGRYVIAKSDFKIGDLILDEEPLLISPIDALGANYQNSDEDFNESKLNCVSCFKLLSKHKMIFCRKCGSPICSRKCQKNLFHIKYECALFVEKKIRISSKAFEKAFDNLHILRAVLMFKDKDQRQWEKFAALCCSFGPKQEEFLAKNIKGIEKYTKILNSCFQLNIESSVVAQIVTTFSINAFRMEGEDEKGISYRAKVVYNLGSLFAHSCSPNADWVIYPIDYNDIKQGHLRVYARRDILRDEPINVSYLTDCLAWGTATRKKFIADSLNFDCKCLRCDDPTEFFYYTEAVKCPFCGDENLTADIPSDDFSSWTCNHCEACSEYSYANKCVEGFKSALDSIMKSPSQSELNAFLALSSNNKIGVSQNHRGRIYAMFFWIRCLSKELFIKLTPHSAESSEVFVKFMERATKCIRVFRMFGNLNDIVEMEACFAHAIAAYYFKSTDFCSIPYDSYLPEEKLQILNSINAHMKSAYNANAIFPSEHSGRVSLEFVLTTGFNFWKRQLEAMKNDGVVHPVWSTGFLRDGAIQVFDQMKTSVGKLWAWLRPGNGNLAIDSNEIILIKPDVSLLTQYDFHFTC